LKKNIIRFNVRVNTAGFLNPQADTPEILILWQGRTIAQSVDVLTPNSVYTLTVVPFPDTLSPTPSTHSLLRTLDPQSPAPSPTLTKTEGTLENTDALRQ
jgi:hypothetical protein